MNKRAALRSRGIFNEFDIASLGTKVYLFKRKGDPRTYGPAWMVSYIGRRFKDAAFHEFGCKSFDNNETGFERAKALVLRLNGGRELVRSPLSRTAWVCAEDLAKAMALPPKEKKYE